MNKLSMLLFATLVVLCLAHGAYYYPQLPDIVDSRFSLTGESVATMGKATMLGFYYGVVLLLGAMFLLFNYLTSRMTPARLNLPNKAFWMAKDREVQTRAFLSSHLLWLGSISMALILYVFHQSFQVTLGVVDRLPRMPWVLGAFLGFVVFWCLGLYLRFARTGGASSPATS